MWTVGVRISRISNIYCTAAVVVRGIRFLSASSSPFCSEREIKTGCIFSRIVFLFRDHGIIELVFVSGVFEPSYFSF